jgi:hypothetical protein
MSSATASDPDAFRKMGGPLAAAIQRQIARRGMSPRQQHLNHLWSYYCAAQYEARATDWDGSPRAGMVEREAIATAGFLPPGFYDPSGQMNELPLKYRRPLAPHHLARVIVNRFTGLLFSARHHPRVEVAGDTRTEEFVAGVVEAARMWPRMILARTYGGAMGSVAVGFAFRQGRPEVEVFDPRWVAPVFRDRANLTLARLTQQYMYPVEEYDRESDAWVTAWYWYRRVLDEQRDVIYRPARVDDVEPDWDRLEDVVAEHRFGFCPVVWIQNTPVQDDIDGEPDCHGAYDAIEEIDALISQASLGTKANCDPTLGIVTNADLPALRKGSGNAIKLPIGSSLDYLEISGSGPQAAREMAKELRAAVLETTQVVLEHPDVAGRTATEIERVYSSMLEKADVLREQYGELGVKPLIEMMLRGAASLAAGRVVDDRIVKGRLDLPPKVVDGKLQERTLGSTDVFIQLRWPPYFEPSLPDAQAAAGAAGAAVGARLIDREHGTKFVADYFGVEDPAKVLEAVKAEDREAEASLVSELTAPAPESADLEGAPRGAEERKAAAEGVMPGQVKFFQYEIEGGIVTINEVRASKGLGPIDDGHLTLPAYRAKHASTFARSAVVEASSTAATLLGVDVEEPT